MTDAQLRAKIRDLITLGDLPNERPRVRRVLQAESSKVTLGWRILAYKRGAEVIRLVA